MTPQQTLALGVRLFVIWYALILVREISASIVVGPRQYDSDWIFLALAGTLISLVVLFFLWRFPMRIAQGLLPDSNELPMQSSSYRMWFTIGTALIGLWFVASAITPIFRNLSVMFLFRSELENAEHLRSLRAGLLYYTVELILGLCIIFGATGIRKLLWRIRDLGE
jgi:hypothetical protein